MCASCMLDKLSLYRLEFCAWIICFVLLVEVAADWLACFPSLAARWLFDEFFIQAPPMETMLNLVPFLEADRGMEQKSDVGLDSSTAVSAQAKRSFYI